MFASENIIFRDFNMNFEEAMIYINSFSQSGRKVNRFIQNKKVVKLNR